MQKLLLLTFFTMLTISIQAQDFSRVRVVLDEDQTIFKLARMGLDVSHGDYVAGKYFTSDFSATEIQAMRTAGFEIKTLIDDVEAHYIEQNLNPNLASRNDHCGEEEDGIVYETPSNFMLGSMGGYYTLQEMEDILDDMISQYPNLISAKQQVGTSVEGRPIWWLRISDNPAMDEPEPEVLYTALHHAREPNSLAQMIYYMWYILENYETDAEIQYLVNETEMYFMPCVNPDGYVWNEMTNPNGGGLWRKNRLENGDGTVGVDLNRNYGYEWGFDNNGSSPNGDSEVYRGTEGFSEPETQAVKAFCEAHEIQIALNNHTFGNLLIYPWGFSDGPTPEHTTFRSLATALTRENDYFHGTGTETVGYVVNGDSDDWMYGEQATKNKIYSMTPEAGSDAFGFWPPSNEIEDICHDNIWQNITLARLVHNFGLADHSGEEFLTDLENEFEFSLMKHGLKTGGLTVSLNPVSDNISWVSSEQNFGLLTNELVGNKFQYVLSDDIKNGEEVVFELEVNYGYASHKETYRKTYNTSDPIFVDSSDDLDMWSIDGLWTTTDEDFYSAPTSITESPNSNYSNNSFSNIALNNPIEIIDAQEAILTYWAKWEIENDWDYTLIQLSVNGGPYINLCGKYTNYGSEEQLEGEPLYDNVQNEWVQEEIYLSEYVDLEEDPEINIQFVFFSDGGVVADGFYFDDVSIIVVEDETTSVQNFEKEDFTFSSRPNPAQDFTILEFSKTLDNANIVIFNTLGQQIFENDLNGKSLEIDIEGWESGIYWVEVFERGEKIGARKLSIVK